MWWMVHLPHSLGVPYRSYQPEPAGSSDPPIVNPVLIRKDDTTAPSDTPPSKTYQIPGIGSVTDSENCGKSVRRKDNSEVSYSVYE